MKHPPGVDIYYRKLETMLLRIKNTGKWEFKQIRGGRWVYVWVPEQNKKNPASGGAEE